MFLNYGSEDFFDNGCLVGDSRISDEGVVRILRCKPMYNEKDRYHFCDCEVNVEDDDIDYDIILDYMGNPEIIDLVRFAICCLEYYGIGKYADSNKWGVYGKAEIERRVEGIKSSANSLVGIVL